MITGPRRTWVRVATHGKMSFVRCLTQIAEEMTLKKIKFPFLGSLLVKAEITRKGLSDLQNENDYST